MSRQIGSVRYHLRSGSYSWLDNLLFALAVLAALLVLSQ